MSSQRAASIRDLCSADHHNDPAAIASWIGDGSPDKFIRLFQDAHVTLMVAEIDDELAGLAGLAGDRVTLNYVRPQFRLRGVSKALMLTLERTMRDADVTVGYLVSTATALRFYRAIGWVDAGVGTPEQGYPMEKRL